MKGIKRSGLVLAAGAAALLASGFVSVNAADSTTTLTVKCGGVNACKGKTDCKTAMNACKGQNSCKGKGWVSMKTTEECTKAKGTVITDQEKAQ